MTAPVDRPALIDRGSKFAFIIVATLFFSWGLANSLNDVLVRHFRKALELGRGEAGLVQSAFYFGYFVAALPAAALMRRCGYKVGILVGLSLYAIGALLFWPAADARQFPLFLAALTVIALGLACLETAANPYITVLGNPATAAARLNLAQAFNGVGAITGPFVGGLFILSGRELDITNGMNAGSIAAYRLGEARAVQLPYLFLALFVIALGVLIWWTRLPEIEGEDSELRAGGLGQTIRLPGVAGAVVAQFFYVAAQVCIWSYFIDFTKEVLPGTPERQVAFLLSSSIALLMVGRFGGAFLLRRIDPAVALTVFAFINAALCLVAVSASGMAAVAALWATSLFMSIMFPTIFALGLRQAGAATETASSLMIMAIIGGALVPPLMGWMADRWHALQPALTVPLLCFLFVARFGWISRPVSGEAA